MAISAIVRPFVLYVKMSNQNIKTQMIARESYPISKIQQLLKQTQS